ncbi:MAG: hypothetical protein PUG60_08150 [Lachnospiraceae bacterium]|nr:hypothetical protein [Lachnospiraceae bacterium]MDY4968983.1 hypothetical protein [Lachnospiraceae bacterium]
MQRKKCRHFLCSLLIFVMLLSGICSPAHGSDSFFSAADQQASASITDTFSRVITCLKACTGEMLGHQESMDLVRRTEQPTVHNTIRICLYTFLLQILFKKPPWILKTIPEALSFRTDFHTTTVRFIQQKDGKKGISCLVHPCYKYATTV